MSKKENLQERQLYINIHILIIILMLCFEINVYYKGIICTHDSLHDISAFMFHFIFGLSIKLVVFYENRDGDVAMLQ